MSVEGCSCTSNTGAYGWFLTAQPFLMCFTKSNDHKLLIFCTSTIHAETLKRDCRFPIKVPGSRGLEGSRQPGPLVCTNVAGLSLDNGAEKPVLL